MKHHIVRIFLSILWGSVVTISASTFAEEGTKLTISPDNCDIVFYCQTTQIIDISPDGSATARNNEAFSIALKGGELKIPQRQTVLGDGTLNWDLTYASCSSKTHAPLSNHFHAKQSDTRFLRFLDGEIQAGDVSFNGRARVWFATCDRFE